MFFLAVDESSKGALVRSRRILSKYFFHRAHATYGAHLSKEGITQVINELNESASKNTSVCIFVSHPVMGLEVYKIIGRKDVFSEEGFYAHRTKSIKSQSDDYFSFTKSQKLIRLILRLSALLHDIGKSNKQFQKMIRGASEFSERIRHELISYFIFRSWKNKLEDPENWLYELSQSEKPFSNIVNNDLTIAIDDELRDFINVKDIEIEDRNLKDLARKYISSEVFSDPIWGSVSWLILTHHRLIGSSGSDYKEPNFVKTQINITPLDPDNLKFVESGLPWDDTAWCNQVKNCALEIYKTINEEPSLLERIKTDKVAWSLTLSNVCRPGLIYSDYIGSLQKEKTSTPSKKDISVAFANTIDEFEGKGESRIKKNYLADTLATHLKRVRRAIDPVYSLCESGHVFLPMIDLDDVPNNSTLKIDMSENSPFFWQREAVASISKVHNIENRPGFFVISSGTGAGKTTGGVQVLQASLKGKLRFTAALGLRSLTLQTGYAYIDQEGMRLNRDDVMTVVGDTLYSNLNDQEKLNEKTKSSSNESNGSEWIEDDELFLVGGRDEKEIGKHLERSLNLKMDELISLFQSKKNISMIETPALVCTVDHLMRASAPIRGGDTRMMLRLATSDLLLDEVDNYSSEDLVALGRLVMNAGAFGRRVVLMSATVSETVVKYLHKAWVSGLKSYDLRRMVNSDHYFCLISDKTKPIISELPTENDANNAIEEFTKSLIDLSVASNQKNRLAELFIGDSGGESNDLIFRKGVELSEMFNTKNSDGASLSLGVVRFNQVKSARSFAKHMYARELPSDVCLKIVCYHRRMPLYNLTVIERTLLKLLNRKKPQAIFDNEIISEWMKSNPGIKKFIVIVAATSIQETGKDNDYDWAITEPWSTRSVVQLAGRVLRHRTGRVSDPNVYIMHKTVKDLNGTDSRKKYLELSYASSNGPLANMPAYISNPSLIDAANKLKKAGGMGAKPEKPELMLAFEKLNTWESNLPKFTSINNSSGFDLVSLNEGITAHLCLRAPKLSQSPITALEHAMTQSWFEGSKGTKSWTLTKIIESNEFHLFESHHKGIRFRRSDAPQVQLTLCPKSKFKKMLVIQKDKRIFNFQEIDFVEIDIPNLDRSLIRLDQITSKEILMDETVPLKIKNHLLFVENPDNNPVRIKNTICYESNSLFSFEAYGQFISSDVALVEYHPLIGADSAK